MRTSSPKPSSNKDGYLDRSPDDYSTQQLSQAEAAGLSTLSGFEVESSTNGRSGQVRRSNSGREGSKPSSPLRSPTKQKKEENVAANVKIENMSAWDTEMPTTTD